MTLTEIAVEVLPMSPHALRRPIPPAQLRVALGEARCAGLGFEDAWKAGMRQVIWPHDTPSRQEWRRALRSTKNEWRAAYENQRTPTSKLMVDVHPLLAEANQRHVA